MHQHTHTHTYTHTHSHTHTHTRTTHSYFFLGAEEHDAHHEHFHCNYGTGVFMDALFGTRFKGSALERQVLARQAPRGRDKVA
jgi:hypothetical protein